MLNVLTKVFILTVDTSSYTFHTQESTWVTAEYICEDEGGHLAIINSEAEAKYIQTLFENHTRHFIAHVGLKKTSRDAEFTTVTGTYQ